MQTEHWFQEAPLQVVQAELQLGHVLSELCQKVAPLQALLHSVVFCKVKVGVSQAEHCVKEGPEHAVQAALQGWQLLSELCQ